MSTTENPPALDADTLAEVTACLGLPIRSADYLTSGAANHVFRLKTAEDSLIMKFCQVEHPGLFDCEAHALAHMQRAGVNVPEVIGVSARFLLMSDLGPERTEIAAEDWQQLGRQLAAMHRVTQDQFGYEHDNYLGIWHQPNPLRDDWLSFYLENRVLNYLEVGKNPQVLTADDRRGIEKLVYKMGERVPPQRPGLCHGDLWKNNVYLAQNGRFYLIDPAIHFGLPEADLASTQLYHCFPDAFYDAYREAFELEDDWQARLPLYQLKEWILMIAQFEHADSLARLRALIRQYA